MTHQAPRFPLVQEQGPKTNKTSSTARRSQCLIDLRPTRALGKFTTENVGYRASSGRGGGRGVSPPYFRDPEITTHPLPYAVFSAPFPSPPFNSTRPDRGAERSKERREQTLNRGSRQSRDWQDSVLKVKAVLVSLLRHVERDSSLLHIYMYIYIYALPELSGQGQRRLRSLSDRDHISEDIRGDRSRDMHTPGGCIPGELRGKKVHRPRLCDDYSLPFIVPLHRGLWGTLFFGSKLTPFYFERIELPWSIIVFESRKNLTRSVALSQLSIVQVTV